MISTGTLHPLKMLLRSSSTPLLGSLLPSNNESPSNNHYQCEISSTTSKTTPPPSSYSKISYGSSGMHSCTTVSCNSSPASPAVGYSSNSFRRAQSDGNLEGLVDATGTVDEFSFKTVPTKPAWKRSGLHLETIPSFSFRKSSHGQEDEDSDEEYAESDEETEVNEDLDGKDELCDSYNQFLMETMGLQDKMRYGSENDIMKYDSDWQEMHLAKGLGVANFCFANSGGPGGGNRDCGGYRPVAFDRNGGDSRGLKMDDHYRRMVEENPGNSLVLRNYAQFLYQEKKDFGAAEEYYSRAILADPSDGEVLSSYAKLVWECHHDKDRARSYFERATQVASEDSHIHAAYANFLWEVEDETEDTPPHGTHVAPHLFHTSAAINSATAY